MISEFVTIGSFEDPFEEFFVEKLYRNPSKDNQRLAELNGVDDHIFKISSDHDKIPVFLNANDTAITIFKIGCDLNLLKTKRQ